MSPRLKMLPLIAFIIIGISPNAFSQQQLTAGKLNTAKTVAIYSSKKSFFSDYPIETLVSHLNSLNANPNITYYKSTEDRSKTGFYADYLIDLDVWLKTSILESPRMQTIQHNTAEVITKADGSKETIYITTSEEKGMNTANFRPGEGEIRIKIIEKRKNEKVSRKTLRATINKEQSLKFVLIISLIEFLLGYSSN